VRVVYKGVDGADFPVEWEDAKDADITWFGEREHLKLPLLPFEQDVVPRLINPAVQRAFAGEGMEVPALLEMRFKVANQWGFIALPAGLQERMNAYWPSVAALNERGGGPWAVWDTRCKPRLQALCKGLAHAADDADPDALASAQWESWGWTMVAMMAAFMPTFGLMGFLGEAFGPEAESLTGALTTGYPNATVEADEDLWQLAQLARGSKAARDAIASGPPFDWKALERDATFWPGFSRYLDTYGDRSEQWQLSAPTLRERPDGTLDRIQRILADGSASPLEILRGAAERRERTVEEVAARFGDAGRAAAFRKLVAAAACYTPVREGRAYWQLVGWGRLRLALLRIGARLARHGRIEKAEDVLFLTAAEIRGDGPRDLRIAVADRRAEWARAVEVPPPETIGAPGPTNLVAALAPPMPERPVAANQIRGTGASRGTLRARARVIASVEDGKRLAKGEIMVCTMTAPPWTPLFAVAGALVTETGGMLSHPSIVAREYGIPCVVGARNAMKRIRDGQMITVDGDEGIVTIDR
jgi:pyruvate,water dikinase